MFKFRICSDDGFDGCWESQGCWGLVWEKSGGILGGIGRSQGVRGTDEDEEFGERRLPRAVRSLRRNLARRFWNQT